MVIEYNQYYYHLFIQQDSVEETNSSQPPALSEIQSIKLPPIYRKRGRPKGHEKTVIGLPCKRHKKGISLNPVPFTRKHPEDRERSNLYNNTFI